MRTIIALVCCSLLCSFAWIGRASNTPTRVPDSQTSADADPVALWEQAIEAKGGRNRLSAVRNLLAAFKDKTDVALYIFPDKVWDWTDDRPTPLGVWVGMRNLELGLSYSLNQDIPEPPQNLGRNSAREVLWDAYHTQLYYLLETQWVKPIPVKVYSGSIGHRPADIVQTIVRYPEAPRANPNGYRVDFHLDRQSHLPLEVAFPSRDSEGTNYGRGTYFVTFSDYADVNGIQMPRRVGYIAKPEIPLSVQVNVEYDPETFEHPPSLKAGPDAWRPKKQRN
jgi:hypothetical protein